MDIDVFDFTGTRIGAREKVAGSYMDGTPRFQLTLHYPGTSEYRARIRRLISDLVNPPSQSDPTVEIGGNR